MLAAAIQTSSAAVRTSASSTNTKFNHAGGGVAGVRSPSSNLVLSPRVGVRDNSSYVLTPTL